MGQGGPGGCLKSKCMPDPQNMIKKAWDDVIETLVNEVIAKAVASGLAVAAIAAAAVALTAVLSENYADAPKAMPIEGDDHPNDAEVDDFNYHASIHWNDKHICSGAFIGTYFILTVAQCVYTYADNQVAKSKLKVYVGIHQIPTSSRFDYAVDKIILAPYFNAHRLAYNLAVLKLTEKVTAPFEVVPITLPSPHMKRGKVVVSGFRNINTPTVLSKMTISKMVIIGKDICKSHFLKKIHTSHKFCVIPRYRYKPCQISQGGPAVNDEEFLMGLYVMQNPKGCSKSLPEIFVDVTKFVDFIREATGSDCSECRE